MIDLDAVKRGLAEVSIYWAIFPNSSEVASKIWAFPGKTLTYWNESV